MKQKTTPLFKCQALLLALLLAALLGTDAWAFNPVNHTLYFENDLFTGTDANYTNGVKYSVISPDLSIHATEGIVPRKVLEQIHKLPFIENSGPEYTHKAEFSLGQNMYTPADITRSDLITDDRPYAGWTYMGLGYHRKSLHDNEAEFLDTVEVQLGMIGPLSFTEESQKFVHEMRRLQRPNGWDHQLKNEPGLALAFERKWLFHQDRTSLFNVDVITHLGSTVGNVYTYVNGGGEIRLGLNMEKSFGVSLIRPAGSTRLNYTEKPSIYLFAANNSKWSIRDIFLDGSTFTSSHSVDKEPFVHDLAAGLTLGYKNVMLTLTEVQRSREFEGQNGRHSFGSLTLSFSFPLGGT